MEDQGYFKNGTKFDCTEIPELTKLEWKTSAYEEESGCTDCLQECEQTTADPEQICELIRNPRPKDNGQYEIAQKSTTQKALGLFRIRIRFWVCIVITPYSISIGFGFSIEW